MNPHNIGYRMAEHNFGHPDPGTGNAINYQEHGQIFGITVAGTETNTVADPTKAGQEFGIFCVARTSGQRTVTFATAVNTASDTTVVFDATGDFAYFKSVRDGADTFAWKIVAADGSPANLGVVTYDDLTVTDDLTVGGDIVMSGTGGITVSDGGISSAVGNVTLTAGNLSVGGTVDTGAASAVTFGAATQQTISDGDGSTNLIPKVQIQGTTKATGSLMLGVANVTNDSTVAPSINFVKNGAASFASNTVVASGEVLGEITWFGANGTDLESPAARIYAGCNAGAGATDMPGALFLQVTPDGSETLASAVIIRDNGTTNIADGKAIIVGAYGVPATYGGGNFIGLEDSGTDPASTYTNSLAMYTPDGGDSLDFLHADGTTDSLGT